MHIYLNMYEESTASFVKIKNPLLVTEIIVDKIKQKATAITIPLAAPIQPPSILLILPMIGRLKILLIAFARNLTKNIRTVKINVIKIACRSVVIIGSATVCVILFAI